MRFPEFTEEWKAETIVDACTLYNGRAYKQEELLPIGKYRVLRVGNFFTNDSWYYSDLELDEQKTIVEGDLLYAWSASFGPRFWTGEKAIYHYHIWKVIPKEHIDKDYLYHFLYKDSLIIKSRTQGGTMVHVTKGDMEKRPISFPCLEEQRKIAKLLSILDDRIATQSKIIEELKKLKSAISLKMLHSDSWEQFKIKDIASIGRGRVISSIEISQQENPLYPVYSSQTSNEGIMGYLDNFMFEGEYISWTTDGANAGTVFYRNGKFNCTNVCGLLKLRNGFDTHFVSLVLSEATKKYVSINLANPKLMNNTMGNIQIHLPKFEEQKRISIIFKKLQELLDVQKHLLCKYSKQKQYLLHQMFI